MRVLVWDVESSGLPLWKEPSGHPDQPHLVQLAAILLDVDSGEREDFDSIVSPDGWVIPDETAAIHGITTERALAEGRPEADVLTDFDALWKRCDLRVAHVETFDARMLRIAYKRFRGDEEADAWKAGNAACTAKLSAPICNLPPTDKMMAAGRNYAKTPKLIEAYQHFFGKDFAGEAHSATADVAACLHIWLKISGREELLARMLAAETAGEAA
jgi:DNA polymerase-3 subunit epsilon